MRMVSRIVKDIYSESHPNNVGLIGVQHMDLNDSDMRNEVLPLSDLQEAVAIDIADGGQSHAETIDRELGSDAGSQVANVIMCASLMRGFDAKAGLSCPFSRFPDAEFHPALFSRLIVTDAGMRGGGRALSDG